MNLNETSSNKKIAKNTLILYFRMFLTIVLQLYAVPIVLKVLGFDDYGLYNVIGGITALFTFVGGSMASGAQRFFSYAIGQNDHKKLETIFRTTINIYLIIAIFSFIAFEIIGTWFLSNKMQIPLGRETASFIVFQFSVFAFIASLLSIPYNAVVIAYEKMAIYAYVSIGSSLFRLVSVILLQYIVFDHLILYAFFIFVVHISESVFYLLYCRSKFVECREWSWKCDHTLTKSLLSYSGFNIIGSFALILRKQGLNIVMNLFFGTVLNAAHSIAIQINGVIEQFVNNLYMASRPQVTKLYAANRIKDMWHLVYRSSLLAFYLIMILAIITIIEMPTILKIWLNHVPAYTVDIARLFILCLLVETTTNQLISVFQAANKIKIYQLFSSTILLLNVPVAYIVLNNNSNDALIPYYLQLIFSLLYVMSIIFISIKVSHLNIIIFFKNVLLREILITLITFSSVFYISSCMKPSLLRVIGTVILTLIMSSFQILIYGIDKCDRLILISKIKKYINSF